MKAAKGDRIVTVGLLRAEHMPSGYEDIPVGSKGTVKMVNPLGGGFTQYGITWDDDPRRSLMLLESDPFIVEKGT